MKIVQIGTNNGKDHVNKFAKYFNKYLEFVLLVEPLEELNDEIYKNYDTIKNVYLENVVISNEDGSCIFNVNPNVTTHSSLDKNHLLKCNHKEENIHRRIIKGIKIESLFNRYKIKNLDCLFIDTEGSDIDIVKKIDFNKYHINYIIFEHVHSKESIYEYENSLKSFGYTVLQLDRSNTILIRNSEYKNDLIFKKILDVFKIPHNKFIKSEPNKFGIKIKSKPFIFSSQLNFKVK